MRRIVHELYGLPAPEPVEEIPPEPVEVVHMQRSRATPGTLCGWPRNGMRVTNRVTECTCPDCQLRLEELASERGMRPEERYWACRIDFCTERVAPAEAA